MAGLRDCSTYQSTHLPLLSTLYERPSKQLISVLEVRPIFVRKDNRTRGHVFVCLLALKLSRELQRRLAATYGTTKDDPHGVTLHDALDTLHRLCLLTYPLDDTHSVTRLPRPDDQQTRLLQALQVPVPRGM